MESQMNESSHVEQRSNVIVQSDDASFAEETVQHSELTLEENPSVEHDQNTEDKQKLIQTSEPKVSDEVEENDPKSNNESHGTSTMDNIQVGQKLNTDNADDDNMRCLYHVKWIYWREERTPIVTQNENGPCPLLAIFNVLLLSKKILLGSAVEIISSNQITAHVADVIWENMPKKLPDDERLNYEQNVSDAMSVFPNLQTGLDVNVKFSNVSSFEYTPELTVFDLLRIPLYHGWLVDPQDFQVQDIIGNNSYNQIVEKIINYSSSEDQSTVESGLIVQQFLESSASQITCHGIVCLCEEMKPGDLAVLFRNNHFSTLYRHKDELFTLITDLGFLQESNVVWETLSSVHGDSHFVDGNFLNSPPKTDSSFADVSNSTDHDYEIALSLQQNQTDIASTSNPDYQITGSTDYELALQLHEQELESRARQSPSGSAHTVKSRPQTAHSPSRQMDDPQHTRRPASAPGHSHMQGSSDSSSSNKCSIL